MSENFFSSYLSRGGYSASVSCLNCRLEQAISPIEPYPNHRFSRKMKFKSPNEDLKWGDFIKSEKNTKCRKCEAIIYKQIIVLIVQDGRNRIAGTVV